LEEEKLKISNYRAITGAKLTVFVDEIEPLFLPMVILSETLLYEDQLYSYQKPQNVDSELLPVK